MSKKKRFGTRVQTIESIPFDVEAYAESAAGISKQINKMSYNLYKCGAAEMKKKKAEIKKLVVIRHELRRHIEKHFEYTEKQEKAA